MLQRISAAALLLCLAAGLRGQGLELGMLLGASSYYGDLAPDKIGEHLQFVHPTYGFYAAWHFDNPFALKLQWSRGALSADDARTSIRSHQKRNLHFYTNLSELKLTGQLSLPLPKWLGLGRRWRTYLDAGIALYHYEPRARIDGRWYDLRPLHTEGRGLPGYPDQYANTQLAIPLGGGIQYRVGRFFTLGVHLNLQRTFTDYLDDVSGRLADPNLLVKTMGSEAAHRVYRNDPDAMEVLLGRFGESFEPPLRGNPDSNDHYWLGGISLSLKNLTLKKLFMKEAVCPSLF